MLRSMWSLFAEGGKQSEEQELRFWQGSHCAVHALRMGGSGAAPGDHSRMMHPGLGECFFPAPGDGAGSDTAQLSPGIRVLGQSWDLPPGTPCFPWAPWRREEFLLG